MEAGGYYSRLLQEYDAVILSSKLLENRPLPVSKEPKSNQPLSVIIAKDPNPVIQIPPITLEEAASKVIIFTDKEMGVESEHGIETVVLDKLKLITVLEHCKSQGLCSVLLDLRAVHDDFKEILKGVEGNLIQKLVVEVLPVWSVGKENVSLEAIKISQRAGLKNFEPKKEGKSVLLEGYF